MTLVGRPNRWKLEARVSTWPHRLAVHPIACRSRRCLETVVTQSINLLADQLARQSAELETAVVTLDDELTTRRWTGKRRNNATHAAVRRNEWHKRSWRSTKWLYGYAVVLTDSTTAIPNVLDGNATSNSKLRYSKWCTKSTRRLPSTLWFPNGSAWLNSHFQT